MAISIQAGSLRNAISALFAALSLFVGLSLAKPQPAHAGSDTFCYNAYLTPGQECGYGPGHSLRRVAAAQISWAPYWPGAAAASWGGGTGGAGYVQYGSFAYAEYWACHSYSGANVLYGKIGASWYYSNYYGQQAWGSGETGC